MVLVVIGLTIYLAHDYAASNKDFVDTLQDRIDDFYLDTKATKK